MYKAQTSPLLGLCFSAPYNHAFAFSSLFSFQNSFATELLIHALCPQTSIALLAFFFRVFSDSNSIAIAHIWELFGKAFKAFDNEKLAYFLFPNFLSSWIAVINIS